MEEEKRPVELPENAYRELKEGEEYQPGSKSLVSWLGYSYGCNLFCSSSLSWSEGWTGV